MEAALTPRLRRPRPKVVTLTDAATGAKTDVRARYSFIYRFEGGDWKIDHLHSSMMPEAAR